ncbi:MAG: TSUP family transporter [bacterium]
MSYAVVAIVALLAAALTFFSGFGLGTLLLPAFSIFFPVEIAIAATAIVHLTNNVFKLGLVGRAANWRVFARFAIPAAAASIAGALILSRMSALSPIATYTLGDRAHEIFPVKLVIAVLMIGFAIVELLPRFHALTFDAKLLPIGGIVSGFFGGLSGHQGAFRSAFLVKAGLSKEAFIATGVASAVAIDVARLGVYGASFFTRHLAALEHAQGAGLIAVATGAAFAGSFIGSRAVKKVTLRGLQMFVGAGLVVLGLALGAGLI